MPRPSPPPGSIGNGAGTLLRPGPCRSRRQGGPVRQIAGILSRHANGSACGRGRPRSRVGASSHHSCASRGHAPACRSRSRCRCGRAVHAWWPFLDNSFSLLSRLQNSAAVTFAGNGHKRHKNTTCDFCAFFVVRKAFSTRSHPKLKKAEPQVCRQDDLPRYEFCKNALMFQNR